MADTYEDTLGDFAVSAPPRPAIRIVIAAIAAVAAVGFWMGLNTADHRTRLPGEVLGGDAPVGPDFSRAKVAVALAPASEAPKAQVVAPVEAPVEQAVVAAPTVVAPATPVVEAPPPAAAPAPTPPPPSLEGLF